MIVAEDSEGDLSSSHKAWWSCGGPCQKVLWAHVWLAQVLSEELAGSEQGTRAGSGSPQSWK